MPFIELYDSTRPGLLKKLPSPFTLLILIRVPHSVFLNRDHDLEMLEYHVWEDETSNPVYCGDSHSVQTPHAPFVNSFYIFGDSHSVQTPMNAIL